MQFILIFFFILCNITDLSAQTLGDIFQQQNQIQLNQQKLNDEEFRRYELRRSINLIDTDIIKNNHDAKQKFSTDKDHANNCVHVKDIEIFGNTILSSEKITNVSNKYKNKCLSIDDINNLMRDITNIYISNGYITSRSYMPVPQIKLIKGILQIKIVEGKVKNISGISESQIITSFPFVRNNILRLRDIEQGLYQINKLSSNSATMDIRPSKDNGYSDIVVTNNKSPRNKINLFTDNAGSKSTGQSRTGIRIATDNLLNINDQLNIGYTGALHNNYDYKKSNSLTFTYNIPFGYWTLTNNLSYSDYRTSFILPISRDRFYSYGDSVNNYFMIDRVLVLGQKYKISGGMGLTYKSNNNYTQVLDLISKSEVGSRNLTILSFDVPMTFYVGNGVLYIKPSFIKGLKIFNALDDKENKFVQRAQYKAYKLYSYYQYYNKYFTNTFTVDSQYSSDELFSSEVFYIGGEYSVRGFKNEGSQGDSGIILRNDIALNLSTLFSNTYKVTDMIIPSVFWDYGYVNSNSKFLKSSKLIGSGLKLSVNYSYFDTSITYSKVIQKEDWMTENHAIYFLTSIHFKF